MNWTVAQERKYQEMIPHADRKKIFFCLQGLLFHFLPYSFGVLNIKDPVHHAIELFNFWVLSIRIAQLLHRALKAVRILFQWIRRWRKIV